MQKDSKEEWKSLLVKGHQKSGSRVTELACSREENILAFHVQFCADKNKNL